MGDEAAGAGSAWPPSAGPGTRNPGRIRTAT